MKWLPLVWSSIWHKPVRTTLIFLQVSVAFALFGVLQGMKSGVDEAVARVRADVLYVGLSTPGGAPLPLAYMQRLRATPGVKTATFADGFVSTYQRPTERVYVLAIEPSDVWRTLVPDIFQILPKDLEALRKTRTGVLTTADIAKKYGWRIGDRIPLTSNTMRRDGSRTWVFDLVGTVTHHEPGEQGLVVANYDYVDEARALNKGTVRNFYVVVSAPKQAAAVGDAIDDTFANSSTGTRTASLRENAQQRVQRIGDLNFVIRSILSAVLVALMFSTATMMMQTVRERTPELAVLKTVGFGDRTIFALVAAEALLLCTTASLAGLALAWVAFPVAAKYVPGLSMPITVVEFGLLGAALVALISVSVPGLLASRLKIVDALAEL